ncbi:MAG: hypothetical protein ACFFA8_14490 [Promethearchaeota archaeon]
MYKKIILVIKIKKKVQIGTCEIYGKEYDKNMRGSRSQGEKLTCSIECETKYNREHQNTQQNAK